MACRECYDLLNPTVEKKIATDEQCAGSCLDQIHEGGVDFAVVSSILRSVGSGAKNSVRSSAA